MNSLVYSDAHLRQVLRETKTIAMVGVSPKTTRPSWFVGNYLSRRGFRMIPVNPGLASDTLFGETVYASLSDIPPEVGPIEMVDIFRASHHVEPIVAEAISALKNRGLKTIWMQINVINEAAASMAESHGLQVIMHRCPKMEYQRLTGELAWGGVNTGIISSRRW